MVSGKPFCQFFGLFLIKAFPSKCRYVDQGRMMHHQKFRNTYIRRQFRRKSGKLRLADAPADPARQ